jgi:hypothetical protein
MSTQAPQRPDRENTAPDAVDRREVPNPTFAAASGAVPPHRSEPDPTAPSEPVREDRHHSGGPIDRETALAILLVGLPYLLYCVLMRAQ